MAEERPGSHNNRFPHSMHDAIEATRTKKNNEVVRQIAQQQGIIINPHAMTVLPAIHHLLPKPENN